MKQLRIRFRLVSLILFALFVVLAVYGVFSINTYGSRWFTFEHNPRISQQKKHVAAGNIYDRNGVLLATTVDGQRVYQENLADRLSVVHLLSSSKGVENFQAGHLYGFNTPLTELVAGMATGRTRTGDSVTLTIDSQLSTAILQAYAAHDLTLGKNGAAVVMNYKTGEVLAEVSLPGFDPAQARTGIIDSNLYINRATHGLYPPGSTFKILTTAAALESLPGVTERSFTCIGGLDVDGQVIHDFGIASHNTLSLRNAFSKSCNITYAMLALDMGDAALRQTAENFGFNGDFLFRDVVVEDSIYPTQPRSNFEIAMSGFGQSTISVTPMHMCMVAAAIANDGLMMEPVLLSAVHSPSGALRERYSSSPYRRALSAENAAILQEYMRNVVSSGTGTRARVSGLTICGKTGSAESSRNGRDVTHGWFVGYCANEELPYAVAILVEDIEDGQGGGSTAAPIAAAIFTYLRDHAENTQH